MKGYSKEQIISEIIKLLKYHKNEKICLLFVNLLLNKVNTKEEITLSEEEISNFLFIKDSIGINDTIFYCLSRLNADLTGVDVKGNTKSNYEPIHCVKEDGSVLFDDVGDDLFGSYYYDEQGNYIHIHLYESMMWDDKSECWKYILRENENNLKFNVE